MAPRSERVLIEEVPLWRSQTNSTTKDTLTSEKSKQKRTTRRLSDFMSSDHPKEVKPPSLGSKRDIWLIHLTDVVVRCQRTGVTQLPIGSFFQSADSKRKGTKEDKKRNLYRFLQVEKWETRDMRTSLRGGMVSMEEVAKYRHSIDSSVSYPDGITEEAEDMRPSVSRMS